MQAISDINGWVSYMITPDWIDQAKNIRAQRDLLYQNLFEEEDTDWRWVGDLGEIVFYHWLAEKEIGEVEWIRENPAGHPDFLVKRLEVEVKTVKRQRAPRLDYECQISAEHSNYPMDQLFFMSYDIAAQKLWLLGGISKVDFLKFARFYRPGDRVHANYVIREGHSIYNGWIKELLPAAKWLQQLKEGKL